MKYYKVKTGYASDDYTVIDENELSKAIKAQVNNSVAIVGGCSISGRNIQKVEPDVNSLMGWNKGYQPTPEDYGEMSSAEREELKEHWILLENTVLKLTGQSPDLANTSLQPGKFSKELSDKMRIDD